MKIHELKSWTQFFEKVISGEKTFEMRVNDRNFQVGDFLFLREYDPVSYRYSGRFQYARVTYILGSTDHALQHALHPDYVIMAISLHWGEPKSVPPGFESGSSNRPEPYFRDMTEAEQKNLQHYYRTRRLNLREPYPTKVM